MADDHIDSENVAPVVGGEGSGHAEAPEASAGKRRRILAYAGAALALALIITISAALNASGPSANDSKDQAAVFATRAADAASREETAQALALAKRALALDPGNQAAKDVVDGVAAAERAAADAGADAGDGGAAGDGGTGAPSPGDPASGGEDAGGTPDTPTPEPGPRDDSEFQKQVEPASLLFSQLQGWTKGATIAEGPDASTSFEPQAGESSAERVVRATVTVHDMESADAATRFVNEVSKRVYSRDVSGPRVGVMDVHFGTDGARLACVAFARGRYAFEVVVATTTVPPVQLKPIALAVAGNLSATK